jgi:hypothetical protein
MRSVSWRLVLLLISCVAMIIALACGWALGVLSPRWFVVAIVALCTGIGIMVAGLLKRAQTYEGAIEEPATTLAGSLSHKWKLVGIWILRGAAESGLDYFGARYLSSMGRWISPDWAVQAQFLGQYSRTAKPPELGRMFVREVDGIDVQRWYENLTGKVSVLCSPLAGSDR